MTSFVAPATLANQVDQELCELFSGMSRYLDKNGLVFTRFNDKLDKLGKADGKARSLLLSELYVAIGDRETAEYYIRNAERLNADKVELDMAHLTVLLNLGYFSESMEVLRRLSHPSSGKTTCLLSSMPGPSIHILEELVYTAEKMKLPNLPDIAATYPVSARIMDMWGDSDEDYAAALDIAGAILRERRLFYVGQLLSVPVEDPADGSEPYVKLTFKVAVDVETSIDMTCDYVDRLARSGRKIPLSLSFEFESVEA